MRWRTGPQNEINEARSSAASPDLEQEEQDQTSSSSSHNREATTTSNKQRLGSSSSGPATLSSNDSSDVENERGGSDDDDEIPCMKDDTPKTGPVNAQPPPADTDADNDETDQAAEPQSPIWKPQTQHSTCEFTHTITNYAQKRETGCKKAEYSETTVDELGNKWRLIIYVNGNGRASNHHLSLFLQVADADDLPFGWRKAVSYVLTLEHPNGGNSGYAKRNPDKTFKLCPKAIDWGWSQFITSDRIQQEGYVSNDSLTVRATVTVKSSSVTIDPDDAELYLKCAVEEGNATAVKACLEQGAEVNCQFKDDLYTPLHTACSSSATTGSLEVLNLLLKQGADGNACNKWKETPLLIAANNGHCAAVDALLHAGADPSLCSEAGWSALTFAAHKGYDDIVTSLLKAGAPVNCRVSEDLSTPMHKACAGGKPGHLSAVKQLLEYDANVHALNKWRETPLLTAANHGQAKAVEALLNKGGDACRCTDTGWSPLSIAAYKGHDDVVQLLLDEGAPTEEDDTTLSALLQAATKGLPDTIMLLLRHGADHTVTTKKGDTALSILVEQNLIDAAVVMVTKYKASIPRCSRDRKKVQRARLLINLRIKQQQRDGLLSLSADDEDETDEEAEESNAALHDNNDRANQSAGSGDGKKKKKGKKNKLSAEAQARAAEEALLLELAEEETKAQKNEAAANSKRAKNKQKKERQRQQRLKEEKEREEKAAEERERQRKIKEAKEQKEREKRLKQQREQEQREAEERAKVAEKEAARLKAKNDKVKRQRELDQKGREKHVVQNSSQPSRSKANGKGRAKNLCQVAPKPEKSSPAESSSGPVKRGWEGNPPPPAADKSLQPQMARPAGVSKSKSDGDAVHPETGTSDDGRVVPASMVAGPKQNAAIPARPNGFEKNASGDPPVNAARSPSSPVPAQRSSDACQHGSQGPAHAEPPAVSLFRQEKLAELVRTCAAARTQPGSNPLGAIGENMIQAVVYRWIVRAAHDKSPYLDPVIPSWSDFEFLTAFLQRQFIAESRKGVGTSSASGMVSMEALKEAGSAFAGLCQSMAKGVVEFRKKLDQQLPCDWSDATLNLTASEVSQNGMDSAVVLEWANRAQTHVSTGDFMKMRERYTGPSSRILSSIFAAKKRHELTQMLVSGTSMECRLSPATQESLARNAAVTVELWSSPLSVRGQNAFFGMYPDLDSNFGGLVPFGKEETGSELALLKHGGSVSVMLPFDNTAASLYVRKIVDLLERGDKDGVPLSFVAFLHSECFRDTNRDPTINDLTVLEPRLGERQGGYVRCAEVLPPGQHGYQDGNGSLAMSRSKSLFVVFQNEAGKIRFPMNDAQLLEIIRSMASNVVPGRETRLVSPSPLGYGEGYASPVPDPAMMNHVVYQEPLSTPSPRTAQQQMHQSPVGAINEPLQSPGIATREPSLTPRRGRLFDLVDTGEDVQDLDVVSGMLNFSNLNPGLFKNAPSQEVDIEAISLMGIGEAPLAGDSSLARTNGRFG